MDYLEELNKSYSGTCVQVEYCGKVYPFFFERIGGSDGEIIGSISINNTWVPHRINIYKDKLLLELPRDGYINYKNKKGKSIALYLSYTPERQWKKGIVTRLAFLYPVDVGENTPTVTEAQVITEIFDPKYVSLSKFLGDATLQSAALSRRLAISRRNETLLVYYCNSFIGYVVDAMIILPRNFSYLHAYVAKFFPCEVE